MPIKFCFGAGFPVNNVRRLTWMASLVRYKPLQYRIVFLSPILSNRSHGVVRSPSYRDHTSHIVLCPKDENHADPASLNNC